MTAVDSVHCVVPLSAANCSTLRRLFNQMTSAVDKGPRPVPEPPGARPAKADQSAVAARPADLQGAG
jgi:hypothetical protein